MAQFIPWGPAGIHVSLSKKSPYIATNHKVSGLSLANHTSINELFKRTLEQYEKLRKRGAFVDQYKKQELFKDSLEEFDLAKESLQSLIAEYEACENADFPSVYESLQKNTNK